ncbi:conserved exported hypothetical protein [Verrucomicrobia bacterium]|nr:conserved exported hypothetical protein [Verrucomicrobiota bacterium]
MKQNCTALITMLAAAASAFGALAQGTAFTYQGRLNDGTSPANGTFDLRFTLYNQPTGGSLVFGPGINLAPAVSNGLFTVTLDYTMGAPFPGSNLWLEIGVRTNGSMAPYATLSPRQQLTPSPFAIYAENSGAVVDNSISAPQLNTPGAPSTGQVLSYNGSGLAWLNPAASSAWSLTGNAGTTPGANFLGTPDNQPLELHVNGTRAWRIEPTGTFPDVFPNIIGGYASNVVDSGAQAATIGGGGAAGFVNQVSSTLGTIAGGSGNVIQANANDATITGGRQNVISAGSWGGVIGGGHGNSIQTNSPYAVIGGGEGNTIQTNTHDSSIGGGNNNLIQSNAVASTIAGGLNNVIQSNAYYSTIGGGDNNLIQRAHDSTIGGGSANTIQSAATISTIGGGSGNTIQANAFLSAIGGGSGNTIQTSAQYITISGGANNSIQANATDSTIGGGANNSVSGPFATVAGGQNNSASGFFGSSTGPATVGGGSGNVASGVSSTVSGGTNNAATGDGCTVGGGIGNTALGAYFLFRYPATVGGGFSNLASGAFSTVPGGWKNQAAGYGSFAAGQNANAIHDNGFVWGDGSQAAYSSASNRFEVLASGGVVFYSGGGSAIYNGGGSWGFSSDRNLKENIAPVDVRTVLDRVCNLPINQWNMKKQDASQKHIGPMAQDFHAAFGLNGSDETHINSADESGVALAAIQGLHDVMKEKDAQIRTLERDLADLRAMVNTLAQKSNGGGQ